MKYIDIDCHVFRDMIQEVLLKQFHIFTNLLVIDILTMTVI